MFTWCKDHSEEGAFDAIKCGHTYTNTVYKSFNERNLDYKCQDVPSIFENVFFLFCFICFFFFYFLPFVYFLLFISLFELFIIEVLDKIWNLPEVNFIHYCTLYKNHNLQSINKRLRNCVPIVWFISETSLYCRNRRMNLNIASIKTLVLVTD